MVGILTIALLLLPARPAAGTVSASFLYPLANFAGPVRSQWAKLAVDPERNEIYALSPRDRDVRIFNRHGMEIYAFEGFYSSNDIAAGDAGEILILSHKYRQTTIHRCNYRGEKLSEITLKNVPEAFASSSPDKMVYRHGSLYLLDSWLLTVIVADADGSFIRGHDLKAALRPSIADEDEEEAKRLARKFDEIEINGFDVDEDGNILFTVPTLFAVFRFSPEGELEEFGRPGSGRGKFGIVAGIAVAPTGHILITDRLRCVVLVFDHDLAFKVEFGYRGGRPSNLIAPNDVAVDAEGRIYVSQAANRGVSVFRMVDDRGTLGVSAGPHEGNSETVGSPANTVERRSMDQ
jgi:DNA-binding beta-propeller fold protein YncE